MVPHAALVNHALAFARKCELHPDDRILQFASISFDVANEEIFPCWLCGATLVINPSHILATFADFMTFVAQQVVTVLNLPASFWHAWVDDLTQTAARLPTTLRLVITGSEQVYPGHYLRWHAITGERIRWLNAYGLTETTITALMFTPADQDLDLAPLRSVPIGRPLDNVQVYLLDRQRQPVPVGVPGELYIGGAGVARGYLNRPDLTSVRFIDLDMRDWGVATGATGIVPDHPLRLYRTGDMARYLPDGTIEFLGRIDQQVKIRGFRIEPGEIETLLGQHPAVAVAVVMAREEMPGEWQLVAYLVPADPEPRSLIPTLRSFLQERLPDYMLPSAFVQLEALPLTPSGKLDRDALPPFDPATRQDQTDYTAPRNPVEATLANIWADVLRRERVSILDNFFALGGHSLQIMQLITQIEAALPYPIAIKDIFLYPTIAGLAEVLSQRSPLPATPAVTPSQPEIDRPDRRETVPHTSSAGSALTLELRPLLTLFAARKVAPVAAATFGTLPLPGMSLALLEQSGVGRTTVIDDWYDNLPLFDELLATHLGRIALFTLPHFDDQLYQDQTGLIASIIEGLEMARWLGARVVSLAGLIPSATDYGRAIATALAGRDDLPLLSTGHATTTAAVILALDRILAESGRDITQERIAFLGLGSVGLAALRLMLRCRPHPEALLLCDIYQKQAELELLQRELATASGFKGTVQIIASPGAVPPELYSATTIIGATNVPNILDITRVNSGTLIVDDSAPHCFDPDQAHQRFEAEQDILFTEGGVVQAPQPITAMRYLPRLAERALPAHAKALFAHYNPHEITGCILSSLLSARFAHLPPTLGYVDLATSFEHYTTLRRLGFRGADLHCEGYTFSASEVTHFRQQFGT
jgi:amino acid adenylation domain-containing protein